MGVTTTQEAICGQSISHLFTQIPQIGAEIQSFHLYQLGLKIWKARLWVWSEVDNVDSSVYGYIVSI